MAVKAKFFVESVMRKAQQGGGFDVEEVQFRASYGAGNEEWCKWTPYADFKMGISNPKAAEQFIPGQYVSVTFEPIEPEPKKEG